MSYFKSIDDAKYVLVIFGPGCVEYKSVIIGILAIDEVVTRAVISHMDTAALDRLCLKWLFTKWPSVKADIRDNSPARTVAAII